MFTQDPDREAGDIAPEWGPWVRYDDPEAKTFKLNVERQNGRAAMLGRAAPCSESDSSGQRLCIYPQAIPGSVGRYIDLVLEIQ